jgi:hypothetical protein
MAKDLTEALRALTEQSGGLTSRVDKTLPAPRVPSAIPARSGASGPISSATGGDAWELKGEKTWATTDGLFTLYMPETLKSNIGGKLITIGAIKTEAPE